MLSRGIKQSPRIVVEDCGVTMDYIKRTCIHRINDGQIIDEVWIRKEGKLELVFKKAKH